MDTDALLVVSFGGPESQGEVLPFLERVTRGRGVPLARLAIVAEQYREAGGCSPLPAANRLLLQRLRELAPSHWRGVYLGNRNSAPFLDEALAQMRMDGVTRAAVHLTSAFSSYSGCRQYRENLAAADPGGLTYRIMPSVRSVPTFDKIWAERIANQLGETPDAALVFTAHSLPVSMASKYTAELEESIGRILSRLPESPRWSLAYQSRSGRPEQPWLAPDVGEEITKLAADGAAGVILAPLGFCAINQEIVWDLDVVARQATEAAGIGYARLSPPQDDPRYADMVIRLGAERATVCEVDCCPNAAGDLSAIGEA